MKQNLKVIISAGGTGGHIFPAIAVANAIKEAKPDADILFVGAVGRMEMEKVPQAGFKIEGLKISGIQRKLTLKNLAVPFRVIGSLCKASKIIHRFKPDVAIGFGGYASGPLLQKAAKHKIPTVLQEQNSYPGLTNKILAKKACKICVAYENMDKFFDTRKIIFTGNPVRKVFTNANVSKNDALSFFGLAHDKFTILAIGGSLGAGTINQSVANIIPDLCNKEYQLIWQTGKHFSKDNYPILQSNNLSNIVVKDFIAEMEMAYSAADVVVSRAGAIAISELQVMGKPVIFIPSPNVAEDHQTKNAMNLVNHNAATMITDADAPEKLGSAIFELANNEDLCKTLSINIKKMAYFNAANEIAKIVIDLAEQKK